MSRTMRKNAKGIAEIAGSSLNIETEIRYALAARRCEFLSFYPDPALDSPPIIMFLLFHFGYQIGAPDHLRMRISSGQNQFDILGFPFHQGYKLSPGNESVTHGDVDFIEDNDPILPAVNRLLGQVPPFSRPAEIFRIRGLFY